MSLSGKIAIVTGASRGIGRGIALQLGGAGAKVYVTGREPTKSLSSIQSDLPNLEKTVNEINERGGKGIGVYVDHSNMKEIENLFKRVDDENKGQLDILVNNAYSGVTAIVENTGKPFWECKPEMWDEINNVGLRSHYFASVYGSRLMVNKRDGLIVNISSSGGLKYFFNVAYGVGKSAMDRMAVDMAIELKPHNVSMISLWPGAVKTEITMKALDAGSFDNTTVDGINIKDMIKEGESIEFPGKCIVSLYNDPKRIRKSGQIHLTSDLGQTYGLKDIDGKVILGLRNTAFLVKLGGFPGVAQYIPRWIKIPGPLISGVFSKL
uniref:Dehydrogenase/reductase SDR family member 1 n=1 Tax=Strongyloides papillosus TaxID=174720 RepID=A0A0N5CEU3_STREA